MTCSGALLPGIEYAQDQTLGSRGALHLDILDGRLEGLILTGRVGNVKPSSGFLTISGLLPSVVYPAMMTS